VKEKKVEKCPYLSEWLITSCVSGETAFVVMPFVLWEYCRTGKFEECPLQQGFKVKVAVESGSAPIS